MPFLALFPPKKVFGDRRSLQESQELSMVVSQS